MTSTPVWTTYYRPATKVLPTILQRSCENSNVDIQIRLRKSTFTTLEYFDGVVHITPSLDTPFSTLDIQFVGTSRSYIPTVVAQVNISGKNEAFHIFLRLRQTHTRKPANHILKAGRTYEFPFEFVVPERLPSNACRHAADSDEVRDEHLQLPPTMGDNELMRQLALPEDLAPTSVSIRYGVYVQLFHNETEGDQRDLSHVVRSAQRVRIIPVRQESLSDQVYVHEQFERRREILIKRSLLDSQRGGLVLEAQQPILRYYISPKTRHNEDCSHPARLVVRFDPSDHSSGPPQLDKLVTMLYTHSFFSSSKQSRIPTKQSVSKDISHSMRSHCRVLSRRCMRTVAWRKYHPLDHSDPDVGSRHNRGPTASKCYLNGPFYLAEILVPIILPHDTTFIPSFHSCSISRTYSLEMRLYLQRSGIANTSVRIIVPMEIYAKGSGSEEFMDQLPSYEQARVASCA